MSTKFWIEKIDYRSGELLEKYYAISDEDKIEYMLKDYDKRHLIRKSVGVFFGLDEEGNCEVTFICKCI